MTIRAGLLAVRLLDYAIDMKRPKNRHSTPVVSNDHTIATRRDIGVIDGGH